MKKLLLIALFVPSVASATPVWSPMPPATNSGSPFYNNPSWDGEFEGIAWRLSGQEYLHDGFGNPVPFVIPGVLSFANLGGTSALLEVHQFSHNPLTGDFVLDTGGNGYVVHSGDPDGIGVLLTRVVSAGWTDYQVWFEDLPFGATDGDWQDEGRAFRIPVELTPTPTDVPVPTPEPAMLLLFGTGLLGMAARRVRRTL